MSQHGRNKKKRECFLIWPSMIAWHPWRLVWNTRPSDRQHPWWIATDKNCSNLQSILYQHQRLKLQRHLQRCRCLSAKKRNFSAKMLSTSLTLRSKLDLKHAVHLHSHASTRHTIQVINIKEGNTRWNQKISTIPNTIVNSQAFKVLIFSSHLHLCHKMSTKEAVSSLQ